MKKLLTAVLASLPVVFTSGTQALPDQCVQAPYRSEPCPNLVYRKAKLPVPALKTAKGQILCICKVDFAELLSKPVSKSEEISQRSRLRRIAADYGLEPEELKSLLAY